MHIRVLMLGSAAQVTGWAERTWPIAPDATAAEVFAQLAAEYPRLAEARARLKLAINEAYAPDHTPLKPGDELAIIPPVSGGASQPEVVPYLTLVTHNPLDLAGLLADLPSAADGAIATFAGVVRPETNPDGQSLRYLEYTAHERMAERELSRIAAELAERDDVSIIRIVHRLGRLALGEASAIIVVAAPHRAAAFEVCREAIERIKESVPIFKREIWATGEPTWVNGI